MLLDTPHQDILAAGGALFLGSRLKRLGERMQADVARFVAAQGLDIQPAQYPILAALDRASPLTVGQLAEAVGQSQPGVTRTLARLTELGLTTADPAPDDARQRAIALTSAGRTLVARSRQAVWPHVHAAAAELLETAAGPLLAQLDALEAALATTPLDHRAAASQGPGLTVRDFEDRFAADFAEIGTEWISALFTLEQTDRDVLENPRASIIEPGGDVFFVESPTLGIIGACALQKTGPGQFELTKLGVRASARGQGAGLLLMREALRRARALTARRLYLLSNKRNTAALVLFARMGFVHDDTIMREFGTRYARCDVAMLYNGGLL